MTDITDSLKNVVLGELYASVDRMNRALCNNDHQAVLEEQERQVLLRAEFEELLRIESQGR